LFLIENPQSFFSKTKRKSPTDVDYLGHMNNASSLTHAEYARWEWTAESGMLQTLMKSNTHFMVASAAVRFRRQIRPIFRKFEVQTRLSGIDDTSFWVYQTFRYPEADNDRIRTQVLIKGVATRGRNVIPPRTVLEDLMDIPSEIVDGMMIQQPSFPPTMNDVSGDDEGDVRDDESKQIQTMLTSFQQLDESFRGAAGADDAKR
jgi:acyl-CoA thioesterase FadM